MRDFNFFNERPVHSYKKSDFILILLTILLTGMGLVTLYFASADRAANHFTDGTQVYLLKQLVSVGVGVAGLLFFSLLNIKVIREFLGLACIIVVALALITLFAGETHNTVARRWIMIPGVNISIQPSELVKFVMVLFLANQFDKREDVMPAVIGLLVFTFIVLPNDFSTGFLILIVGILMFFACGAKLMWLLPGSALAVPFAILFVSQSANRVERIINFISPEKSSDGNYQVSRALMAIVSGGWLGRGMGTGLVKTEYVPEIASDYIFAGWAEATGFVGVVIFIILMAAICWRIYYCAFTCYDKFASYVCFGFGTFIVVQTLLNIAIVADLLPSTGIPLPFFSAGGTSIVMTLCMCGFVINASRIEKKETETRIEDVVYE